MSRFCLFVLLSFATTAAAQSPQSQIITLPDASWQYHDGDDPRCGTISGDGCTLLAAGDPDTLSGPVVWERSTVNLPDSLRAPQQLGVLIEGELCFYEVFINGHSIGSQGNLETQRGPYNSRAIFTFPSTLAQNGTLVISVRAGTLLQNLASDFSPRLDRAVGSLKPVEARYAENTALHIRAQWQHYLCFIPVFCIGLFFLLLYALDRSSTEHLWIALYLGGIAALRLLELGSFVDLGLGCFPSQLMSDGLEMTARLSAVQLGFSLTKRRVWPVFRLVQVASVVTLLPLLVYLPPIFRAHVSHLRDFTVPSILIGATLSELAFLVPLRSCFKSTLPEMRWIGAALLFLWFEDVNRYVGYLSWFRLGHIPTMPQDVSVGALDLDIRGMAVLLFATVMLVAMTVRFRRLQARNRQVELDLEAARTVQRLLIPAEAPKTPGFAIESFYLPAQEVGGDFFHVAPALDDSVLIVVGDVSGKGLSAAMTVSTIIGALRTSHERDPSQLLTELNKALHGFISGFATCCVALLTPDGQLTLANAGHLSPYRNGAELTLSGSLPLGISSDVIYSSEQFSLGPGDHLTFVSDGVVESAGSRDELFGFERTAAISGQSAQSIASAAQKFGEGAQADDITVLTLDCIGRQR